MGLIRERCCPEVSPRQFRRAPATSTNSTVISANLELGEGNAVFIRGAGAGLRWDVGQKLDCVGPKTWVWSVQASREIIEFQLLLNDEVWEKGEARVLEPGNSIELTPDFEWPEIPRISLPKANVRPTDDSW